MNQSSIKESKIKTYKINFSLQKMTALSKQRKLVWQLKKINNLKKIIESFRKNFKIKSKLKKQ